MTSVRLALLNALAVRRADLDVVDEHGTLVRSSGTAHGGVAKRKSTFVGSVVKGKKPNGWGIDARTSAYWDSVVVHQGWLLKKGGLAKQWIKRYAVLYATSMGHFLCYYADFAKAPLFHADARERRIIDLCKTVSRKPLQFHFNMTLYESMRAMVVS